ncbi:hypothetical protein LBMAG27_04590 [Bacteroidota bacterium]|nr:hypothetical protein LBMAG27_04590 [Bacteroidota bacterium]
MNKILLKSIVVISVCWFSFHFNQNKMNKKNETQSEAMEMNDEEGGYLKWELMRLADPATGKVPEHMRAKELEFSATLPNDGNMRSGIFTNRGPWNVGGRTRAFAMDINDTSILIAGSVAGDIWRSSDAGNTWTVVSPDVTPFGITCLIQDKRIGHTNTWYAGTGEGYGTSASGGGAFYLGDGVVKSTDNGLTWTKLSSTSSANTTGFDKEFDIVWSMATDNSNAIEDEVYASTYGMLYRSIDGGANWNVAIGSTTSPCYFTDVQVTTTGVVYVTMSDDGIKKGIWRSNDGIAFVNILPDSFPVNYNRIVMGINPMNENEIYFSANTPGAGTPDTNFQGDVEWNSLWKYNYLSGDGSDTGGAWVDLSMNLPTNGGLFDKYTCQGSYDMVVKVKPDDTSTVFLCGTNIYRSTTGFADPNHTRFIGGYKEGATLPQVKGYDNHHPDQHVLFFHPNNPNTLFSSNDGGIFKTTNCMEDTVHWSTFNHGYLTSMFYTAAVDNASANDPIIVAGAQDNGSWFTNNTNPTSPWVTPRGGDGSYCAIADNKTAFYFSIQNGKVMKTKLNTLNGTVDSFARIDPIPKQDYLFINPFIIDPVDNNKMYLAGGTRLYRNNNLAGIPYASNWDSITTNWMYFADTVVSPTQISALTCSTTPAHTLYYGTTKKKIYKVLNADTGNPSRIDITSTSTSAIFPASGYINCIAVDPHDANKLLVVFSNYNVYSLFYSDNGGTSWKKTAGNLEAYATGAGNGPSVRWASFLHLADGNTAYLVATSIGLFATDKLQSDSTVWVKQATNTIGNSVCDMIVTRENDGLVVIATHSRGIFSANLTSINDIATIKNIKDDVAIVNLYPNPTSTQSVLQIQMKQNAYAKIELFDLAGRKMQSVFTGNLLSGENKLKLNVQSLPSGMYLCKISSEYFEKVIPVSVVRD